MPASYIHIAYNLYVNRIGKTIKISNSFLGQLLHLTCSYCFPIILASSQLTCKIHGQEIAFCVQIMVDFCHVSQAPFQELCKMSISQLPCEFEIQLINFLYIRREQMYNTSSLPSATFNIWIYTPFILSFQPHITLF